MHSFIPRTSLMLVCGLVLSLTPLRADTVTGTVVDSNAKAVANAKVVFVGVITTFRTDTNGFFTATVPAGTYTIQIIPSASLAPLELTNIVVSGTLNLGTITLKPGFLLSGTVQDTSNMPVLGANIDVVDSTSEAPLFLVNDGTDTAGKFQIVVPAGTFDVIVKPPVTTSLAPHQTPNVTVTTATSIGTITLKPGFTLSGTVVDPNMQAVVQADINVVDATTRRSVFLLNDNTDVLGKFSVVIPAGLYDVRIRPPASILLVSKEIRNVKVAAATSLGTVTLPLGVLLVGKVVDAGNGAALAQVDIDIENAVTGESIATSNDDTDSRGVFRVVAPSGLLHVSFSPPKGSTHTGKEVFNVQVNGNTNMGTVPLTKGFAVSGTVLGPASAAVADADIDVLTSPGRVSVFIAHDNTDSSGNFRVVVPAGTYELTVEPQPGSGLVGARKKMVAVSANTQLPTMTLATGVTLSGTITGFQGKPEFDADIDVVNPTTGEELVTANDNTTFNGNYSVTVPNGTWDVRIQTSKTSLSRVATLKGVVVNGATIRNHKLSAVPIATFLETHGIPTVTNGSSVLAILAFWNISSVTQGTRASLVLTDPNGKETTILGPLAGQLVSQQLFLAVTPIGLPTVNASLLGQQFRLELRFDDPNTAAEQDHSSFRFFIR